MSCTPLSVSPHDVEMLRYWTQHIQDSCDAFTPAKLARIRKICPKTAEGHTDEILACLTELERLARRLEVVNNEVCCLRFPASSPIPPCVEDPIFRKPDLPVHRPPVRRSPILHSETGGTRMQRTLNSVGRRTDYFVHSLQCACNDCANFNM